MKVSKQITPDITFDYNNMMSDYIGEEQGITDNELRMTRNAALEAYSYFK